jgi:integrase
MKGTVIRTFTSEEVLRLLAATRHRTRRFTARGGDFLECAVNIAAFCGLRYGEVMALSLDTADLDQRVFRVRHSLTRWDVLKAPKTKAGVRDVPIPTHVALMVRDWIAKHYVPNERGLIFRTASGGAYNGGNFHNNDWGLLLVRAGLREGERFHFHALRHFAASWMIEHGLPLTDVASLLGHSKFDMTLQVYAHPVVGGNRRHEAMDRMASALVAAPLLIEATKEQRSPLSV